MISINKITQKVLFLKGLIMKLFMMLMLFISSLFAGGSVGSVDVVTKYEKMDMKLANPCETCGEPAELLPYNGEDLPEAKTYPCPKIDECIHPD